MSTKCSYCGQTVEDGKVCTTMACPGRESSETEISEEGKNIPYQHKEE